MANVGMSKQVGGDRVSTISLLGCSTSVALATGPTDEEEGKEVLIFVALCQFYTFIYILLCFTNNKL